MPAIKLDDNAGFTAPPGVPSWTPTLASGIKLTDAATGANHEQAVVAGATYVLMTDATSGGAFLFGLATTATAANVIWFMPESSVLRIHIPTGYTVLHYQALANGASCYIARLQ